MLQYVVGSVNLIGMCPLLPFIYFKLGPLVWCDEMMPDQWIKNSVRTWIGPPSFLMLYDPGCWCQPGIYSQNIWIFSFSHTTVTWVDGLLWERFRGIVMLYMVYINHYIEQSFLLVTYLILWSVSSELKNSSVSKTGKWIFTFYWTAALTPYNPIYPSLLFTI